MKKETKIALIILAIAIFISGIIGVIVVGLNNNSKEIEVKGKEELYDKVEEYLISKEQPHYFVEEKNAKPNYNVSDFQVFTDIARLGIKEKDDETYVYIWALVESYYVQDGKLISNGGYSIPHKFIIKDNEIIDYKIPRDGSEYSKSIKEIFPLDIRNKLNDDLVDGNKIDNQVKEHYSYLQDDKISISIKEGTLTKKGITLIIKNNAKQNYFYGSQYYLEKEENGTFNVYEPKEILSWNDVLYSLKSNEQIEIEINWIIGYDELSNGKYRLVKKFTTEENITSSANVQENFYVEFEIK
mgnify:FL=1|jgi:hypothetical protein